MDEEDVYMEVLGKERLDQYVVFIPLAVGLGIRDND